MGESCGMTPLPQLPVGGHHSTRFLMCYGELDALNSHLAEGTHLKSGGSSDDGLAESLWVLSRKHLAPLLMPTKGNPFSGGSYSCKGVSLVNSCESKLVSQGCSLENKTMVRKTSEKDDSVRDS